MVWRLKQKQLNHGDNKCVLIKLKCLPSVSNNVFNVMNYKLLNIFDFKIFQELTSMNVQADVCSGRLV